MGIIFLWIAFNAAYADENEFQSSAPGERAAFVSYFGRLVALDRERRIYKAVWQRFSGPVRLLMDNRYVFNPFWQHHNGIDGFADWEARFATARQSFHGVFQRGDTAKVLTLVSIGFTCFATRLSTVARHGTAASTARRSATARRSSAFSYRCLST